MTEEQRLQEGRELFDSMMEKRDTIKSILAARLEAHRKIGCEADNNHEPIMGVIWTPHGLQFFPGDTLTNFVDSLPISDPEKQKEVALYDLAGYTVFLDMIEKAVNEAGVARSSALMESVTDGVLKALKILGEQSNANIDVSVMSGAELRGLLGDEVVDKLFWMGEDNNEGEDD